MAFARLIYQRWARTRLADDNYRRALRLAPRNPDLSNNYGLFLCQRRRPAAEAMALFRYGAEGPALRVAGQGHGQCRQLQPEDEEFRRGRALSARCAALRPGAAGHQRGLARVYFERRDYQRAGFFINRLTETAKLDTLSADVLWLAIRVKHKLGDRTAEASLAAQLAKRFPGSPEYAAFERGAFNE